MPMEKPGAATPDSVPVISAYALLHPSRRYFRIVNDGKAEKVIVSREAPPKPTDVTQAGFTYGYRHSLSVAVTRAQLVLKLPRRCQSMYFFHDYLWAIGQRAAR